MSNKSKTVMIHLAVIVCFSTIGFIFGSALFKLERITQSVEKIESRLSEFADTAQPVFEAGADKAIEALTGVDAENISEGIDEIVDEGKEKVKDLINRSK